MPKLVFLIIMLYGGHQAIGQDQLNSDPNEAVFVVSDITHFWRAYDSTRGKTTEDQERIFQTVYLDKASAGFQSWIEKRDKHVEKLVKGVNSMTPFFESVRENTFKVEAYEEEMRAGFYAFKYLYPDAVFPDVYSFVWDFFHSGSTVSDAGLLIATETQTISNNTPMDQFPEIHRRMIRSFTLKNLTPVVVHESVHLQQPDLETTTLLERAIREGSADYLAELATDRNPSQAVHDYANPKEQELWKRFQKVMLGNENGDWIHTIPDDKPAGLGYWMGYKIVEAYYQKQADKKQAIHKLLTTTDYSAIYEESRYAEKFK